MKIHTGFEQNSLEWLTARSGIPTASEFDQLLTPKFEPRTGQMPQSYLARKLAERWIGGALAGFSSIDMDFGKILEEEAVPFYEFTFSEPIQRVALVTTDDGRIGCSPDGLIGDDGGIEIKCPEAQTHVKYLLAGKVPDDYLAQVHGSMFVTGRRWWKFMSYRRHFPPLIVTVERDEKIQDAIKETVEGFVWLLDKAYQRLSILNGGEPIRRQTREPQPEPEPIGITP